MGEGREEELKFNFIYTSILPESYDEQASMCIKKCKYGKKNSDAVLFKIFKNLYNFKGYFPLPVNTKYLLHFLCCIVHPRAYLIPSTLYLPPAPGKH